MATPGITTPWEGVHIPPWALVFFIFAPLHFFGPWVAASFALHATALPPSLAKASVLLRLGFVFVKLFQWVWDWRKCCTFGCT